MSAKTNCGLAGPDLLITGISRSGTSYLCNLLHRFDNCVALNEPAEILSLMTTEEVPRSLPHFYRERRRDILAGKPIENKLLDGEVVEDTAVYQTRHEYHPNVASADFVLAVKNTREFLLRFGAVRRVMPTARAIACVRNPFDTIASWKTSFRHLHEVDLAPFLGHPRHLWLPDLQRETLERIGATGDLATRRALWWCFQAQRVVEHKDELLLVDYDELVARPALVLERILRGYLPGAVRRPIMASIARSKRGLLDEADRRAIETFCSEVAVELSLSIRGS